MDFYPKMGKNGFLAKKLIFLDHQRSILVTLWCKSGPRGPVDLISTTNRLLYHLQMIFFEFLSQKKCLSSACPVPVLSGTLPMTIT